MSGFEILAIIGFLLVISTLYVIYSRLVALEAILRRILEIQERKALSRIPDDD